MDTPSNSKLTGGSSDGVPWRTVEEELQRGYQVSDEEGEPLFSYMKDDPPMSGVSEALIIGSIDQKDEAQRNFVNCFAQAVLKQGTWIRIK